MRRIAATIAVLCGLTAQAPAPQPAASTLPEIGRTHSKGFCTTIRDNVAPAVLGLMKTDELIAAGHRALVKTAHDQRTAPAALELDRVYLQKVVVSMAHNLGVIKKLLGDEKRFPKTAASEDERYALLLKAQLQAAADRQNDALNHVNGILENELMVSMRRDIDTAMQSSLGATSTAPTSSSAGFLDASALPGSGPAALGAPAVVPPSNTLGHSTWDQLIADVETQQKRIAGAEQQLSPTVVAAAVACRGEATPAPAATP